MIGDVCPDSGNHRPLWTPYSDGAAQASRKRNSDLWEGFCGQTKHLGVLQENKQGDQWENLAVSVMVICVRAVKDPYQLGQARTGHLFIDTCQSIRSSTFLK